MIVDAIRTIIVPVLLLAVVIVIGLYYNREGYADYIVAPDPYCPKGQYSPVTGGICTGDPNMTYDQTIYDDPYLDALGALRKYQYALQGYNNGNTNKKTTTTTKNGSNVGSNTDSNSPTDETDTILNNILYKIMDNSTAELSLEIDYDGRGDWPEYTSEEHQLADEMQDDCVNKREIKEIVDNELACKMGRTTGNQMYYNDDDEDEEETAAIRQGSEHKKAKKGMKCPTIDTNQWIRKDSIPCWGCDLE